LVEFYLRLLNLCSRSVCSDQPFETDLGQRASLAGTAAQWRRCGIERKLHSVRLLAISQNLQAI
jgi:hypothetical protein